MQRRFFLLAAVAASTLFAQAPQLSTERPTLVVAIAVDQMRYDYLTRFGPDLGGGLRRLLEQGAVFTNANYEVAPTVTAVGHSIYLSGAVPALSAIVGNSWYERAEGKNVQSITDDQVQTLGGEAPPASPKRLAVSTIGDELKVSGKGGKVFGVSLKDRSAILPAGRMADGAFWFDNRTGNFVSSTYYFNALPAWVQQFNAARLADRYAGRGWLDVKLPATPGPQLYSALDASPFSDELVLEFSLRLLEAERLGAGPRTDLLAVSFSALDYVGHGVGPDSPRTRDTVLQLDRAIGRLITAAERQAGAGKLLVVLTADHGVAPVPEENRARKLPGGRYNGQAERAAVEAALKAQFGDGDYIAASSDAGYYLNLATLAAKKLPRVEVERAVAATLRQLPEVYRVYTRTDLETGAVAGDRIDQRVRNGFHPHHSGDVVVLHMPNYLGGGSGTSHGTPFPYDTHVPVIFWGPGHLVKRGQYHRDAAVHDIAPTLATLLGIARPSGALGRVLEEMLP
jgi:hypothetical protein